MNRKLQIGPGAASLLLIAIVLSMSVLGVLMLMNAQSDYQLSLGSTALTEDVYRLNEQAEESLRRLAEACGDKPMEEVGSVLPAGMEADGDIILWTETVDNRALDCAVRLEDTEAGRIYTWVTHAFYTVMEEMDFYPFAR